MDGSSEEREQAQRSEETDDQAEQKVRELEGDPPRDLQDWPDDEAKYKTFGGPEGETGYEEGPTADLGEADVRHHEDGSVTVGGEKVDNPDDYKGEPIPGGPTDPNTPSISGERDLSGEGGSGSGEGGSGSGEDDSGSGEGNSGSGEGDEEQD